MPTLLILSVISIAVTSASFICVLALFFAFRADSALGRWADKYATDALRRAGVRPSRISASGADSAISLHELAAVEKNLPNLKAVYVISQIIEEPTPDLAKAVIDNFGEAVEYQFFVSSESMKRRDLEIYREWFDHLYNAAKLSARKVNGRSIRETESLDELFCIHVLKGEWLNPPYIFYLYEENDTPEILAFRGSKLRSGISPYYQSISKEDALTIMDVCSRHSPDFRVALPPDEIQINENVPGTVVPLVRRGV